MTQRAVTLIEILIVISFVSILGTLFLLGGHAYLKKNRFYTNIAMLSQWLQTAYNYVESERKDIEIGIYHDGERWVFTAIDYFAANEEILKPLIITTPINLQIDQHPISSLHYHIAYYGSKELPQQLEFSFGDQRNYLLLQSFPCTVRIDTRPIVNTLEKSLPYDIL